ncbi:SIS domain-containing protein [Leifsonia sp. L25]|uniref:SIS domain-containing protein n=1 Tax=Actinomycetes TaxID=1760 RepID=UPI003D6965B3
MSTPSTSSGFEADIREQPDALRRLAAAEMPGELRSLASRGWDRIVFTGMGSSYFAGMPTSRELAASGRPTWCVDASTLLDTPGLLTPRTLVVATSQSGASGEIVELLDRRPSGAVTAAAVIGITDDETSPLAKNADLFLPLNSGAEATVSTKSYLNTLGVHRLLTAAFTGEEESAVREEIDAMADAVASAIAAPSFGEIAARLVAAPDRRIAMVGWADDATTALYSALIVKESSKLAAEGFAGGAFRHGPYELAGEGLLAVLFSAAAPTVDRRLHALASDLVDSGAAVVIVGGEAPDGAISIGLRGRTTVEGLATGAVAAELIAVDLSHANGVTPGSFAYGSKVTTAL